MKALLFLLLFIPSVCFGQDWCAQTLQPPTGGEPAPLAGTLGEQRTLTLLVTFTDNPSQPFTTAYAEAIVYTYVNAFVIENSLGKAWLSGSVYGWFPLPIAGASCNISEIAFHAQAAASRAGVRLSDYSRIVYAFPGIPCGWVGFGTIGGTPSQAWINGGFSYGTIAHELGHGLGLFHSGSLDCGSTTLGSLCSHDEYGDTFDTMGGLARGDYNALQRERLGWDEPGDIQTSGVYALAPYELPSAGFRSLRIDAGGQSYYIEYRLAYGFDFWLSSLGLPPGVQIRRAFGLKPQLLDLTPETAPFEDAALTYGRNFIAPGVRIQLLYADANQAIVEVIVDPVVIPPPPPVPANVLEVHATTDQTTYHRGDSVLVSIRARLEGRPINAKVTVVVSRPDGKSIKKGVTAKKSDGTTAVRLKLTRKFPLGWYEVRTVARYKKQAENFVIASFLVVE